MVIREGFLDGYAFVDAEFDFLVLKEDVSRVHDDEFGVGCRTGVAWRRGRGG